MADYLASTNQHPLRSVNQSAVMWTGTVTFGSSSIASQSFPDPKIVFTRSTTGTFTVTYPALPEGKGAFHFSWFSPSPTIVSTVISVKDQDAGTMTVLSLGTSHTAADPASGDVLYVTFIGESRA